MYKYIHTYIQTSDDDNRERRRMYIQHSNNNNNYSTTINSSINSINSKHLLELLHLAIATMESTIYNTITLVPVNNT